MPSWPKSPVGSPAAGFHPVLPLGRTPLAPTGPGYGKGHLDGLPGYPPQKGHPVSSADQVL